jgi:hypothetical protein
MSNGAVRGTDDAVLESIRRLLSDAPPQSRQVAPVNMTGEKLLLTPALRVEGPVAPPEPDSATLAVAWTLEDRIAELEAAVGANPQDWEPDGSEDADQERPSRLLFQHRPLPLGGRETVPPPAAEKAEPLTLTSSMSAEEDDDDPAEGFDIDADDRLPDEDALRDLVAEIVRQELQSDLGQRVTRNIRKLVRREIRRALAARDFD